MALGSLGPPVGYRGYSFLDKRGEPISIRKLHPSQHQRLLDAYLAFRPRDSFEGLPPIKDDACVKWVRRMARTGVNLIAIGARRDIVGHSAIFSVDQHDCEMLLVVWPQWQNLGIGTELAQCSIDMAHQVGFRRILLCVEAANLRARHVYQKHGFRALGTATQGELAMALDLGPIP